MNIKCDPIHNKYVDNAVNLVIKAYHQERKSVSCLPLFDFTTMLRKKITNLFSKGSGVVALNGDEVVGFLAGFEVEEFFGKCKGIYCPVYGHGTSGKYGTQIYQKMYQQAADAWVKKSYFTHAITLFTHDESVITTWFRLGFGLRCIDAIRESTPIFKGEPIVRVIKADRTGIPSLIEIHKEHNAYYRTSPLFMPNRPEDPLKDLTEWMEKEDHHLWAAYSHEKPIGYMRIQPNAESFISEYEKMMNITGAYVKENYRRSHIGTLLLDAIQRWLLDNEYSFCGVDYESFNILGSSFWEKYFIPYTYSVVRRIDERIV